MTGAREPDLVLTKHLHGASSGKVTVEDSGADPARDHANQKEGLLAQDRPPAPELIPGTTLGVCCATSPFSLYQQVQTNVNGSHVYSLGAQTKATSSGR